MDQDLFDVIMERLPVETRADLQKSAEATVDQCIREGVLKELFESNRDAAVQMVQREMLSRMIQSEL